MHQGKAKTKQSGAAVECAGGRQRFPTPAMAAKGQRLRPSSVSRATTVRSSSTTKRAADSSARLLAKLTSHRLGWEDCYRRIRVGAGSNIARKAVEGRRVGRRGDVDRRAQLRRWPYISGSQHDCVVVGTDRAPGRLASNTGHPGHHSFYVHRNAYTGATCTSCRRAHVGGQPPSAVGHRVCTARSCRGRTTAAYARPASACRGSLRPLPSHRQPTRP
ncbi:hypothetical protein LMG23994_06506 [Cupriavidus pinatubonensis]|uniref:Uncharacterized protein n=1 Tax=Cupriavidus pinatubonensis TaxID=248026 RepID=A0ABN7ZM49_9BURK|nr:hypothetical protein LMG23994_06506 [Cupriavidus pinatubonensis]